MTFEITGEHNTATVYTSQPREDAEDEAVEQIQTIVDHEAFVGDGDISIMPDFHWGAGAVIGFTMPVKNRVVPNTIGVDIGCGMLATNFGNISADSRADIDEKIRERVPTGFDVHQNTDYHIGDDFPWKECERKLESFNETTGRDIESPEYGLEYFKDLCSRVGYDQGRAINSLGTLGGGNHFIELGRDTQGNVWSVIHSGSRGIGAEIAQHWQDEATAVTTSRQSLDDIPVETRAYMTDNWKPNADAIRETFEGKEIQNKFDEVSQAIQEHGPSSSNRNTDLDYLEGGEMDGYIIDMIFAQTYASESRKEMRNSVADAFDDVNYGAELNSNMWRYDEIESVHNYIDFDDAVVRKGACSAGDGERLVVPFNMKYGTIIAEGKGKPAWNSSSAHGAGRAMSRTEAKSRFDSDDFEEQTDGVFMSKKPMDEIPGAYKTPEDVESALGGNVDVVERITPFLSIKAE